MSDLTETRLESLEIGAAPLVEALCERLDLEKLFGASLPQKSLGRRSDLAPARTLTVMVRNVLLSRLPLYAVPAWLGRYVPELLGLSAGQERLFNDDRIGRELDRLFDADQAALVTSLVLKAISRFTIDVSQLHNDSTTVTFSGKYDTQCNETAPWITFGFNKDHRPDLKQLVYSLTISADGAVPMHFKTHDGNVTDDTTHIGTWRTPCRLVGGTDFLYVADSKLCVSATMKYIADHEGAFLTILPRTRAEDGWFKRQYLPNHVIEWVEVRRDRQRRKRHEPDNVYGGFQSPQHGKEGFRVLWYKSSAKLQEDQIKRFKRIAAARGKIEALQTRRGRGALKSIETAQKAAQEVLDKFNVDRYLKVRAVHRVYNEFQQAGRGRPGPDTLYQRVPVEYIVFEIDEDGQAIRDDALTDGLFPLITNSKTLTLADALAKYKYRPFLEKRNEQLKSVLSVAPICLKKPERIASLLCVYFIALLIYALIEREVRRRMEIANIESLPLYPEERLCKAPTTELVFSAFAGLRRHRLLDSDGNVLKVFHDPLPPVARRVLALLDIDPAVYGPAS